MNCRGNDSAPSWTHPITLIHALLDFHHQLLEAGVELVIVPVPPKSIVYPDKLPSTVERDAEPLPRLDVHHQAFYELLHENGVNVLDLTSLFLANRHHPNGSLYCQQDTHWSGTATVLAAEQIATGVRSKPWFEAVPGTTLQNEWRTVEIAGDLWRALAEPPLAKEHLSLRFVGTDTEGAPIPVAKGIGTSSRPARGGGDGNHGPTYASVLADVGVVSESPARGRCERTKLPEGQAELVGGNTSRASATPLT